MESSPLSGAVEFIKKYIEVLEPDAGTGIDISYPSFELTAKKFLEYAEKDLNSPDSTHCLINCVGNLKRALDNQLDTFLYILNLYEYVRKYNFGIDKKLEFIANIGLFNSRTLSKFNTIRNRLEHHYETPKIEDIELMFDLVAAFISILENAEYLVFWIGEIRFYVSNEINISLEYNIEKPAIRVNIADKEFIIDKEIPTKNHEDFAKAMRLIFMLRRFEMTNNSEILIDNIKNFMQ